MKSSLVLPYHPLRANYLLVNMFISKLHRFGSEERDIDAEVALALGIKLCSCGDESLLFESGSGGRSST